MESDDNLCREVSTIHDDSPTLEVIDKRIGNQSFKSSGSVDFMPLEPGAGSTFENATTVAGGCSTYGNFMKGNTIDRGLTQMSNSGSGPAFFWIDGIQVASRFPIPPNVSGVLTLRVGKYEFQVWTLQSEPVGIIKVTTSKSSEQAELARRAALKIRNIGQRKKLIEALRPQTVARLQNANLEVTYDRGMFSITNDSHRDTVKVESLSKRKGIFLWIHDGILIAGGITLNEEFREIFEIERKKKHMMKTA